MPDELSIDDPDRARLVAQALSGELRFRILELLGSRPRNLNEIAAALSVPMSTAAVSVQKLEEAGLVESRPVPGARGMQKICSRRYDRVVINLAGGGRPEAGDVIDMPVGHYSLAAVSPPCGICTATEWLGGRNDPRVFFYPERVDAQLIWFTTGFVEYSFPNPRAGGEPARSLSVSAELCSEVPFYDNKAESDISLSINGVAVGVWRSPGDFGGRRGRLTPAFWGANKTQFGLLVDWTIDGEGSYVNGARASDARLADLRLAESASIRVRLGVDPGSERPGGVNLFGAGFGDYPQGLVMRLA